MSVIGSRAMATIVVVLLAALPGVAQERITSVEQLSAVERTSPDFYNAIGSRLEVRWSAEPLKIPLDRELMLTLTVRNAVNPQELKRPDLRSRDDFSQHFQIIDDPSVPVNKDATEVLFRYRLVPKARGSVVIPALPFAYCRPELPEGKRIKTAYAEAVPVTITDPTPSPEMLIPPPPIQAPATFFELEDPTNRSVRWPLLAWIIPLIVTPLGVLVWVWVSRWFFPDAMRRAKLRRIRAVRIALKQLKKATVAPDPVAATAVAFRRYLNARFSMPASAQTPEEVHTMLMTLAPQQADSARNFLWKCDTNRFAMAGVSPLSLPHEAERIILTWEGGRS